MKTIMNEIDVKMKKKKTNLFLIANEEQLDVFFLLLLMKQINKLLN